MRHICVLGLGYIGLPTVITLVGAGFSVCGVDIRQDLIDNLYAGRLSMEEPGLSEAFANARATGRLSLSSAVPESEAFIITVQTPFKVRADGVAEAELCFVESAARSIARVLRPGNLVVLESTVPPGTCRRLEDILSELSGLSKDIFYVAHCPERVIPGRILQELRDNDRIIGARTRKALDLARDIYGPVMVNGKPRLTDDLTAELCKLVENTFRDINIAYANELSIVAGKLGVDVFKLIELANCHPRVDILNPGVGVGGHCIAVDPWFIHSLLPDSTSLIACARKVNDHKPHYVAQTVAASLPAGARICVLGLSYKPDIDDLRQSPSLTMCRDLRARGFCVSACEPHVRRDVIEGFANLSLEKALEEEYLILSVGHTIFKDNRDRIAARPHFDCVGIIRR